MVRSNFSSRIFFWLACVGVCLGFGSFGLDRAVAQVPSAEQIEKAKAVIAAFAAQPGAGAVGIDGKMYDRPHLVRAQRLLAAAGQG